MCSLESGEVQYFPNQNMHLENSTCSDNPTSHQGIYKEFSRTTVIAKDNFRNGSLQFCKIDTTLYFFTSPDKARFRELDLSCLHWLDFGNLEMKLLVFHGTSI